MSTKRTSAEPSSDERTIECSDSITRQEDYTKRARLASLRGTKLNDLPVEVVEHILIEAITMEVEGMMLARYVWKEKAIRVLNRYRAVCLLWGGIINTSSFQERLHNALIGTAEKKINLEILYQCPIQLYVIKVATMKDEVFMLCRPENEDPFINVSDCDNIAKVNDVVPLPGMQPEDMAGCSVSNCVYLLNKESNCFSVLRIKRNQVRRFIITPWINDLGLSFPAARLFMSIKGDLIILFKELAPKPSEVSIYNATGSLKHALALFPEIHGFRFIFSVIRKSNGNLVLATIGDAHNATVLKEINPIGRIVRQYHSSLFGDSGVVDADAHGRIMIAGVGNKADLLDSEFNRLDFDVSRQNENIIQIPHGMHYNSEMDQIVRFYQSAFGNPTLRALSIFRFASE